MFKGHALFGIIQRKATNHFTTIRITFNYRRLPGFSWTKGLLFKEYTKAAFGFHTAVTGNTMFIEKGFNFSTEINRGAAVACGSADHPGQTENDQ